MIIGGISLYRSFAMYEEKASFDVLKGTVPDFSTKDINLAFTIDGQTQTDKNFPNKSEGYIVEKVECEDNVTADWNNGSWSLENIENKGTAKKVKCTVAFKTIDTTSGLNGAEPVLGAGMIPVKIGDKGVVTKVDAENQDKSWYDYDAKQWANAVILTEEAQNKEHEDGIIPEEDIESYFVWIPKFSYQLFDENMGKYIVATTSLDTKKQNKAINIKFGVVNTEDIEGECRTPMLPNGVQGASGESGHCKVGDYMTHPAFLAFEGITGFWVGKFNASQANSKIQIKPNQNMWIMSAILTAYNNSKNYKPDLQSHLMKNTEWGAVAYLTQSLYGRCNKVEGVISCEKVRINNNSNYITGFASVKEPTSDYTGTSNSTNTFGPTAKSTDSSISYNYMNPLSTNASTTGNYSGIYDMSGGNWEMVMGITETYYNSNVQTLTDSRYFDIYVDINNSQLWNRRILGDATGEAGPFILFSSAPQYKSSMHGEVANFIYSGYYFFYRGSFESAGHLAGVFAFGRGQNGESASFRITLAVK